MSNLTAEAQSVSDMSKPSFIVASNSSSVAQLCKMRDFRTVHNSSNDLMNLSVLRRVGGSKSCPQGWKGMLSERFEGASGADGRAGESRPAQGPSKAAVVMTEQSAFARRIQCAYSHDRGEWSYLLNMIRE